MNANWKAVTRDVLILFGLTFLGGFFVGLFGYGQAVLGILNFIFMIIAFSISGALIKKERFKHLTIVAIVVWLASFLNIFLGANIIHLFLNIIFIFITMGIGGAISFIFVPSLKE